MAQKDYVSKAKDFFRGLSEYPEAKDDLKRFNMKFLFTVNDGNPFAVNAKNGKFTVIEGEVAYEKSTDLRFISDTKTLVGIFEGKIPSQPAVTTVWGGKGGEIYVLGWKAKQSPVAWFKRLLYLGQKARTQ